VTSGRSGERLENGGRWSVVSGQDEAALSALMVQLQVVVRKARQSRQGSLGTSGQVVIAVDRDGQNGWRVGPPVDVVAAVDPQQDPAAQLERLAKALA